MDEGVRTQVNSVLSTEQEMNRQVFALIVFNKFLPPPRCRTSAGEQTNVAPAPPRSELAEQPGEQLVEPDQQ